MYNFCNHIYSTDSLKKDPDPGSGSGSIIPDFQFKNPDPKFMISDPQHCMILWRSIVDLAPGQVQDGGVEEIVAHEDRPLQARRPHRNGAVTGTCAIMPP